MLQLIPRPAFARIVANGQSERHARGFTCWGQTRGYAVLPSGSSPRACARSAKACRPVKASYDIWACAGRRAIHAGLRQRPSALGDLSESVPVSPDPPAGPVGRCKTNRHASSSLPGKLLNLDSTLIDLCAKVFDWAKHKQTKRAVKFHLLLDHDGCLPQFAVITDGKTSGIETARALAFAPGTCW